MPIEPDLKDWTWVLERRCPECCFSGAEVDREDLGHMIRDNALAWIAVLGRPRPKPHPYLGPRLSSRDLRGL